MIVVDTDVITYLTLPVSMRSEMAQAAFRIDPVWTAPILWLYEYTNVLWQYVKAEEASMQQAQEALNKSQAIVRTHSGFLSRNDVLRLACEKSHPAYDCFYVRLAEQLEVPLVTGDKPLARKFPERVVLLEDFVVQDN